MRTLFFAQSDDAVRLAASLSCGLLIGGGITMTMDKKQAVRVLTSLMRSRIQVLEQIRRKRSLRPSERAMATATTEREFDALAFAIGILQRVEEDI